MIFRSTTLAFALALSLPAAASAYDGTLAEVIFIAADYCPMHTMEADGRELKIDNDTNALFSVVGTHHGGDGRRTFSLPKLNAPEGMKYCIVMVGSYPSRP